MLKKLYANQMLFCSLCVLLLILAYTNSSAQSVKRQSISSYGSVYAADKLNVSQTAGQSYNTTSSSEKKEAILQGFQQPNTFLIEEVTSDIPQELNLIVYPNPATYSVTLKSDTEMEQSLIQVTDISGKQIYTEKVSNMSQHSINCEMWTNGIYLITITDGLKKTRKTVRLIISK